jgi:hypothetical protein
MRSELKDLIFLKSIIPDTEFEQKVNISSEVVKLQKEINVLNTKLFEQKVGENEFFDVLFEQSFNPLKSRYDDILVKNESTELFSPNGQISDMNEGVQRVINSKEFKDWFGDWSNAYFYKNLPDFGGLNISKVLSDKFEPLIVWHGTGAEFSYFKFDKFPANYFAVNKSYSDFFAELHSKDGKGYVLPFFLDIKNPLDLSIFGIESVEPQVFFDWMFLKTGLTEDQLDLNPLFLDKNMPPRPIWVYIRNNPKMLQKLAKENVYDGIEFYEFNPNIEKSDIAYQTKAYVIFNPHQAKLADPSRGEVLLASLKSFMLKYGGKI